MAEKPLGSGPKGACGTDKAVNEMQINVQIMTRGNVNSPQVRRIPATEPKLLSNLRVQQPLYLFHAIPHPSLKTSHVFTSILLHVTFLFLHLIKHESRYLRYNIIRVHYPQHLSPLLLQPPPKAPVSDSGAAEGDHRHMRCPEKTVFYVIRC
ncbi:hypothetical protein V8G54_021874 [Vigna mungo]|uniref:Uncharacterized protein n=1 Tax=Vigna mungo TaxID=3915 RepID=A0AAQ3NI63_VIGMU